MRRSDLGAWAVAAALLASCAGSPDLAPRPTAVEPAAGYGAEVTAVVIRGDGFYADPSQSTAGERSLRVLHRAWLGDVELGDVQWIDVHTLRAVAPAGMPPGVLDVTVENAFGARGSLSAAYRAVAGRPAALSAAIDVQPQVASVGQAVTIALTVRNDGGSDALGVLPAIVLGGSGAAVPDDAPAARDIPLGAAATFTWTCRASMPGTVIARASAAGRDVNTGALVASAEASAAPLQVVAPAALALDVALAPGRISVGQALSIVVTVANRGGAAARAVAPSVSVVIGAGAPQVLASAAPQDVPAGGLAQYAFTFTAAAPGQVTFPVSASGTDENSGASLSASFSAGPVLVQRPAALSAVVIAAPPSPMSTGQTAPLTLRITNTGEATALLSSASAGIAGAALTAGAAPSVPPSLAAGASADLTWTVTATASGTASVAPTVSYADQNSGLALAAAAPGVPVTVQVAAALQVSITTAAPAVATVGQALSVTIHVANTGAAAARLASADVRLTGTALAVATSPSVPATLAGGAAVDLAWTFTAGLVGAATLAPSVSAADANSGVDLSRSVAPSTVTVETPAALSASLALAPPASVHAGETFSVTLHVDDGGDAPAALASTALGLVGAALAVVTAPALPPSLDGHAGLDLSWTISAQSPGSATVAPTLSGSDAVSGQPLTASLGLVSVTVLAPVALSATVSAPWGVATKDDFSVTLHLVNDGNFEATATPSVATSGPVNSAPPLPTGSVTIPAHGSVDWTWTYTARSAGTAAFTFTVPWTDLGGASGTTTASPGPVTIADALLLATDPFADGTSLADVAAFQGRLVVGPRRDGAGLVTMDADGSAPQALTLALPKDVDATGTTSANGAAGAPPFPSIGAPGCIGNTLACGPDGESGYGLLANVHFAGVDRLVLGGARPSGLRYAYLAADLAPPVAFSFADLQQATGALPLTTATAALGFQGALYLGYAASGSARPGLIALSTAPAVGGLQAIAGTDVVNLRADLIPGVGSAAASSPNTAAPAMVDALAEFDGRLYLANNGGIVRSRAANARPGAADAAPGDWVLCTPTAPEYGAKASIVLAGPAGAAVAPADRAFPALAAFGGRLFAARNTVDGPQLWRCDPGLSGATDACDPGDWQLVAPNAKGDSALTQLGGAGNARIALLAATPSHLYVGFDDANGVQIFRTTSPSAAASDFNGAGHCNVGSPGCGPFGGVGLGDASNALILAARALELGGSTSLYIVTGSGTGPVRIYRLPE